MKGFRPRTSPKATYTLDELVIWRTKLPRVKNALLPPSNSRPNPAVMDSRVFASIFAPGAVYALDRRTGQVIWRRRIGKYASASVYLHSGALFAQSANALFRLSPVSGKAIWCFCPFGADRETIYSSPYVHGSKLFIGDRKGFLNCLDTTTGQVIWKQLTNDASEDVNATPIVVGGNVIVATNAGTAVAYTLAGKLAWKTELDGPSVLGLFTDKGSVGIAADSLYLLNPATGRVRRRISWKGDRIRFVERSSDRVTLALTGCWPPGGGSHLMLVSGPETRRRYHLGSGLVFRFAGETRLMYESHFEGVNIRHPSNGELLSEIRFPELEDAGLVDVKDGTIFALTGRGTVYALRHPPLG
jgi:PQQ-like domain/PQQ enzyme repeat